MKYKQNSLLVLLLMSSSACSTYQLAGDVLSGYAVDHLVPHLMATTDLQAACETGVSLSALLSSFRRVTDEPHKAAIASLVAASTCAEERAWNEELRQLRALKAGRIEEAQDARIAEKQAHREAGQRTAQAFHHLTQAYGEPSETCPELNKPNDELLWLLGLTGIVQAVMHDRATGGVLGIPLDLPRKAVKGLKCLNNTQWWGVPNALEAAIWVGIPGATPEGADPWKNLEASAQIGDGAGVRMARAIQAQAAATVGKAELLQTSIQKAAKALAETKAPKEWSLLDLLAIRQMRALSDRIWTESKGHRTPMGEFGSFGEDETDDAAEDLLDLGD